MVSRLKVAICMTLGLVLLTTVTVYAADKTHEGKVVSVTAGTVGADGKLVMTDNDGENEHSHAISATAKITLNEKAAKLTDLKKGDSIKVTANEDKKVPNRPPSAH